ncbi:hypothetical protein GCM10018953_06850 [Streptosporangium nondiastaticum]
MGGDHERPERERLRRPALRSPLSVWPQGYGGPPRTGKQSGFSIGEGRGPGGKGEATASGPYGRASHGAEVGGCSGRLQNARNPRARGQAEGRKSPELSHNAGRNTHPPQREPPTNPAPTNPAPTNPAPTNPPNTG